MGRALLLAMTIASLSAQDQTTFRSGISLVELDASVFDEHGPVEGLKGSDFVVKDEGRPVSLRYCVLEDSPLDLMLLFELSRMMSANREALRGASEVAMASVREDDRVGIMAFSDGARLELPLSGDLKEAKRRVRFGLAYATFGSRPFVLSAVAEAAKYQAAQPKPHGRRAILMFGANTGFGTVSGHAGVTAGLWAADTILSGIVMPTSWTRLIYDQNPYRIFGMMNNPSTFPRFDYVDDVAAETGGEMIYTEDAGPIKRTRDPYASLRLAIQHMRRRYRLYYDMPDGKPGQRRRVQIDLSMTARQLHPEAKIVARKGYAVPTPTSPNPNLPQ